MWCQGGGSRGLEWETCRGEGKRRRALRRTALRAASIGTNPREQSVEGLGGEGSGGL